MTVNYYSTITTIHVFYNCGRKQSVTCFWVGPFFEKRPAEKNSGYCMNREEEKKKEEKDKKRPAVNKREKKKISPISPNTTLFCVLKTYFCQKFSSKVKLHQKKK